MQIPEHGPAGIEVHSSGGPVVPSGSSYRPGHNGTRVMVGTMVIHGLLDATAMGDGAPLADVLRNGFSIDVAGAGLTRAEQVRFLPCNAMSRCGGSGREVAAFRQRSGNLFSMSIKAPGRSFALPLSPAAVTVTLSTTGLDQAARVSKCSVRGGNGQTVYCRP